MWLLTGEGPLRLHSLLARYIAERANEVRPRQLQQIREALANHFLRAARAVSERPTDAPAVGILTTFSTDPLRWRQRSPERAGVELDAMVIGTALLEIGQFSEAQPWYERAVAEAEQGDVHGRVDHASLKILREGLAKSRTARQKLD
jgi:hypothetical protein